MLKTNNDETPVQSIRSVFTKHVIADGTNVCIFSD